MAQARFIKISKWIVTLIAVGIFAITLVYFFGKTIKIDNHSMSDTINCDEIVLLDSLKYKIFDVNRYDIIYFNISPNKTSIKRVVGLPNEQVSIDNGNVYINGNLLDLKDRNGSYDIAGIAEEDFTLGDDEYFVLGDNSDSSEDSRFISIGNIKKEDIIGKMWFKLKPFGVIK